LSGSAIRTAVIPAAGLGTRMLPATKVVPKELLPVLDRPAIDYAVAEAAAAGIRDVVIVTAPSKMSLAAYFARRPDLERMLAARGQRELVSGLQQIGCGCRVRFVEQPAPRGLGDAIARARGLVGVQPFAVLLPDVLIDAAPGALSQLVAAFDGDPLLLVHEVERAEVRRYGIVAPDPRRPGRLSDLVEKPAPEAAPSRLAVTGRYILTAEVFDALAATPPGAGGEIQLTDALRRLLQAGRPLRWRRVRGQVHDLGSLAGWLAANLALASRRGLLSAGEDALAPTAEVALQ
jgi:UTP--glucose-1-phosphate uridylyltransferase